MSATDQCVCRPATPLMWRDVGGRRTIEGQSLGTCQRQLGCWKTHPTFLLPFLSIFHLTSTTPEDQARTLDSNHGSIPSRHPTSEGPHNRQHHRECAHDKLTMPGPKTEIPPRATRLARPRLRPRDPPQHKRMDGRN